MIHVCAHREKVLKALRESSEASMPARIIFDSFTEVGFSEIRPVFWSDEKFGVAELPKQEIGKSEFTRGADEKIGVGIFPGIKMFGNCVIVDFSC